MIKQVQSIQDNRTVIKAEYPQLERRKTREPQREDKLEENNPNLIC